MPTFELIVYGCQMNDYDAEVLAAVMAAAGYEEAAPGEDADATLVYTCAVRQSATDRALGRINSLAARKRARPGSVVGVGGCWPAVAADAIRAAAPHVDFTFPTTALERVPALIARARGLDAPDASAVSSPRRRSWPRANVSIMTGCDNFCSYCVVPYARGPEESRTAAAVLGELEELIATGFKDVTFIGQNVNRWRDRGLTFAGLLREADARCDGAFLRFTTNHPRDLGDDVIAALAAGRNLARHLHLPLQSGSDRVLAAMNRGYGRDRYRDIVARARDAVPGVCLTTDILVGFPGETAADFDATFALVEEVRFDGAYTFIYSPRPGTAAAALPDDVPRPEKVRRLQALAHCQQAVSREINERMVGKTVTAVVEGRSARGRGQLAGRLSENKVVNFEGTTAVGAYARVKITAASSWTLVGEVA
jgi:tRNA-2-methylthio-N6-dimethylallyladenosine synthase